VRRYLPELIDLVWNRKINPGKVFDLTLPLDQVAEGYRAMDERRAIKTLLRPQDATPRDGVNAGKGKGRRSWRSKETGHGPLRRGRANTSLARCALTRSLKQKGDAQ
jgi:hypothetical protein